MSVTDPLVHQVLDTEAQGAAAEIFQEFISQGKTVPKWVRVMANDSDILVNFYKMFKATMDDTPLPKVLKWKVAQVVSTLNECEFCLDVTHAQLKQFGLTDEQIEKVEETDDKREKIAMEFAKAATKEAYKIDPQITKEIKENFNDSELVELAAVVGLFNYINRFNDSLGVLPG
jgi:AhpD family alkylhydroperoxidase